MQNWHKYSNYRKRKNPDGSYTYTIIIDGEDVEVDKEIYTEYSAMARNRFL